MRLRQAWPFAYLLFLKCWQPFFGQVSLVDRLAPAVLFELDFCPFAECRYSDCLQFCYRLSEGFLMLWFYSLCTEDFQCEEYPQRVLFLFYPLVYGGDRLPCWSLRNWHITITEVYVLLHDAFDSGFCSVCYHLFPA